MKESKFQSDLKKELKEMFPRMYNY